MMVNKKAVNTLSKIMLKNNKMRNLFVIIAIILTTVLFTTIFTAGGSLVKGFEEQMMRQTGTRAHGTFVNLTQQQYDDISKHIGIKELGDFNLIAQASNEELNKRNTIVMYGSDSKAKMSFAYPNMGSMPTDVNEIVLDTIVLDALGIPHELGQIVELEFNIGENINQMEFVLSGIYKGDILAQGSIAWVSQDFLLDIDIEGNANIWDHKNLDIMFNNSFNIEKKLANAILDSGYTLEDVEYRVNWAYTAFSDSPLDISGLMMGILLFLVIIFTGYLVIYSIFSISVTKDIRFYGMLKTIGTTPTQIRKLVRNQVFKLTFIGIPVGLLVGYGLGVLLLPTIVASVTLEKAVVSVNPIIFIGSALFALLTVYLGSKKPAKIAAKITPVEALKYQNSSIKKQNRKSKNTKIYKLAWNNLLRDKKKSIIIIITLFLSLIILNSAYSLSKGMNAETYINFTIPADYTVASIKYYNYRFNENYDSVTDTLIERIDSTNMVEDGAKIYYTSIEHDLTDSALRNYTDFFSKVEEDHDFDDYRKQELDRYRYEGVAVPLITYGLNEYGLNKLEPRVGELDAEKFLSGNYIVLGAFSNISKEAPYNVGDKIILEFNDTNKTYKVLAIALLPYSMSVKYYQIGSLDCFLPDTEFERIYDSPSIMSYIFDIKPSYQEDMEKLLSDYTTKEEITMNYQSKQTVAKKFEGSQKMNLIVGGVLSFIIGLIGVANFINSTLAGIITRKTELAIMKSIGMTNRQLKRMLRYEGLYYGGFSVVLALVVETASRNFITRIFGDSMWAYDYQFTILPILIVSPMIIIISILIPYYANKKASKISTIEQLRGIE